MKLYGITNGIGYYYVVADDPTQAERKLEKRLEDEDYGFTKDRKAKSIDVIADQITDDKFGVSGKFFMS